MAIESTAPGHIGEGRGRSAPGAAPAEPGPPEDLAPARFSSAVFAGAGLTVAIGISLLAVGAQDVGRPAIFIALILSALATIALAVRAYRPTEPGWRLILLGLGAFLVGNVVNNGLLPLLGQSASFPSPADAVFILGYPCLVAAFTGLTWHGRRDDRAAYTFSLMFGLAIGLAIWVSLLSGFAGAAATPTLGTTLYPTLDAIVLVAAVQAVASLRLRSWARIWLVIAAAALFGADTLRAVSILGDPGLVAGGDPLAPIRRAAYVLVYVAFALSAIHPSMAEARSDEAPSSRRLRLSRWRVAILVAVAAAAPTAIPMAAQRGSAEGLIAAAWAIAIVALAVVQLLVVIEERGQIELELARQAGILANVRDAVIVTDLAGIVTYWNEGATATFGRPADEMVGRDLSPIYPLGAGSAGRDASLAGVLAGTDIRSEWNARHADGRSIWVDVRTMVFRDEGGQPIGFLGVSKDVTDRHETSARLALMVAESSDVIVRVDLPDGRILDANPAACGLLGYDLGHLRTRGLDEFLVASDAESVVSPSMLAATSAQDRRFLSRDGREILVELHAQHLSDGSVLVTGRDRTVERASEEHLRESQKMESIGRLAGGIAHDFNNLLTVVNGHAELLAMAVPVDDERRVDVDGIIRSGERAAGLTRQLLAFSRRQVLQPTVLDLAEAVAETAPLMRRLIGEHIDLRVVSPGPAYVRADRSQLDQVLINLVVNARDAMPNGGRLTIETTNVEVSAGDAVRWPGAHVGTYVRLMVGDSGAGMDAETAQHAFEPFFTTKESGRGTGLGLATVDSVVDRGGGFVALDSEIGRGTRVAVHLPSVGAPQPMRPQPAPPSAGTGRGRLLVVEDDDAVRSLTVRIVRDLGYDVIQAASPRQALDIPPATLDTIDLLITDMVMPGMTGQDLSIQLATRHPLLRTLFVSGYAPETAFAGGQLTGGTTFLAKPFSRDALAEKILAALRPVGADWEVPFSTVGIDGRAGAQPGGPSGLV
ncbi:MAG: PAS domain S-box protein [Candidatus Limnocylindrales bacterium]